MDATHIHLMITHLPIFGALIGMMVLIFGMIRNNAGAKLSSYGIFVLSAVGAGISYLTGEGAEESVEELPGVMESMIGQHEDFALYALVSLIVLGVASLWAMFMNNTTGAVAKTSSMLVLFLSLISFGLVAYTGYLGGQIRHTEIRTGAVVGTSEKGGENGSEKGGEKAGEKDDD